MVPKILSIISIVALAGAGYLGYENKKNLDDTRNRLSSTKTMLANTEQTLKETKTALKDRNEAYADLEEVKQTLEVDLETEKSKVRDHVVTIQTLTTEKDGLTAKLAEVQKILDDFPDMASIDEIKRKLADLEEANNRLLNEKKALEEEKATIVAQFEAKEKVIRDLNEEKLDRQKGIIRNGLEAQVTAVNPNWGFVIINAGSNRGAVTGAPMLIKRGGANIGKVRISTVEPRLSVADIEPGSVPKGVSILPGDRVIFIEKAR